jgi:cell division protein FtsA
VRELVRERLRDLCGRIVAAVAQSGVGALPCAVLCGGASQQPGLPELAGPLLGIAVRQARIEQLPGMPEAFVNPAFATTVGLARVALDPTVAMRADRSPARARGYLTRVGEWLAESF